MKQEVELVKGLRFELHMFDVPIGGPALEHCDNEAVHKNPLTLQSILNKKMHGMACHFCREKLLLKHLELLRKTL